jgi:hypothetical protein
MTDQWNLIVRAAETLCHDSGPPRERLLKASEEFWQSLMYPEEWPPELLDKAHSVCRVLLKHGTIQVTISRMDAEALDRLIAWLAGQFTRILADLETARREGRLGTSELYA